MNLKPTPEPTAEELAAYLELLNKVYAFPAQIPHKFIGKNSDAFRASVAELQGLYVGLRNRTERTSESGKHLSLTFVFHANSAEEILRLVSSTRRLPDILWVI